MFTDPQLPVVRVLSVFKGRLPIVPFLSLLGVEKVVTGPQI